MAAPVTDETAKALRRLWFDYLDTIEPIRPKLHAYCLRLTGSVWDGEDLVQDTLLRGFGAIGRSDMNKFTDRQEWQWFQKPQAYLSQIATNLWIDRQRRRSRETLEAEITSETTPAPQIITPAAGAALFARTSPQERAAIVLKDVFDFSLEDIAGMLATTTGAVKSALHRGRERLGEEHEPMIARQNPASADLIDRFIDAFNARDVKAMTALLLSSVTWEVQGVGSERGTDTIWLNVAIREALRAERHVVAGARVLAFTFVAPNGKKYLAGLERMEESEGQISRIINYLFCPETLKFVAAELGLEAWLVGYHQDGETLQRMIAGAGLPWRAEDAPSS